MHLNNTLLTLITDNNLLSFRDGQDLQLGGCLRDFRNRPNPVRLKLRYYENVLTVSTVITDTIVIKKKYKIKVTKYFIC